MKKIYMWQPYYLFDVNAYLPYSVAALAAYAWQDDVIKRNYELAGLFYLRTPIQDVVRTLDTPFLCAFSCYVWNYEYNIKLAYEIKKQFPECKMVFGGHQISEEIVRDDLSNHGDLTQICDYIIYDEGEVPFYELLKHFITGTDANLIPNISFFEEDRYVFGPRVNIKVDELPSPYVMGLFDRLLADQDKYQFSTIIETNRGCPYTCAYCDWGGAYKGKLRLFPMDRVKSELKWCAENKIEYVFCADSNFGLLERDEEIADYAIELFKEHGYPKKFRAQFAKNTNERVFRINQKLEKCGMNKGATLSFQSMSPKVLEIIGRRNIKTAFFMELLKKYEDAGIPTYSEIIMALPGETVDSFAHGLSELLKSGQHKAINIYPCELLPNSSMGQKDFVEKYKIRTIKAPVTRIYTHKDEDPIQEYSRFIVSNSTLSLEEWKECYYFAWAVQCFHAMGLTRCIAIYFFKEMGVEYDSFYRSMLEFLKAYPNTIGGKALGHVKGIVMNFLKDNEKDLSYYNSMFGDISWPVEEGTYLEILTHIKRFYIELKSFILDRISDASILEELIKYQEAILRKPFDENRTLVFSYDFESYFANADSKSLDLYQRTSKYIIKVDSDFSDWKEFSKHVIWYGGRKNDALQYKLASYDAV